MGVCEINVLDYKENGKPKANSLLDPRMVGIFDLLYLTFSRVPWTEIRAVPPAVVPMRNARATLRKSSKPLIFIT